VEEKPLLAFPMRPYLPEGFMRKETKRLVSKKAAFSLIELLVALSILAVVAAVIVPKFLNVKSQAVEAVLSDHVTQLNSMYQQWLSLGGSYVNPPSGGITEDHLAPYKILQFLSSSGASRGVWASGPTDSAGAISSSIVSFAGVPCVSQIAADGTITNPYPTSSSPDGFYVYGTAEDASYNRHANIYLKSGSLVYQIELDYVGGNLKFISLYLNSDQMGWDNYMYGKYKVGVAGPRSSA
jgi:prepilin-type N-terminal cleavage/methylation domain-containing protein